MRAFAGNGLALAISIVGVLASPAMPQPRSRLPVDVPVKPATPLYLKRGARAFSDHFEPAAAGYSRNNAYLLMYLASAVYPERLAMIAGKPDDEDYAISLHKNEGSFFEKEFTRLLSYLFDSPRFTFVGTPINPKGYDAEAMVIDAKDSVVVVFRGTDRRADHPPGSTGWNWGEWIETDFEISTMDPGSGIPGRVHVGFWRSLRSSVGRKEFRQLLFDTIESYDPDRSKALWLTGHSLGAAYSQVFAAYLESRGRQVNGVYAFASPRVGDPAFASHLDSRLDGTRLQRFEFFNDPVVSTAPGALGYAHAGVRNFHPKLKALDRDVPERLPVEDYRFIPALAQVIGSAVAAASPIRLHVMGLDHFCFHHPEWYLGAAYYQLSSATRRQMPFHLTLPDASCDACSPLSIRQAHEGDTFQEVAETIGEAVDAIAYDVGQLLKNETGTAIAEGQYYFRCHQGRKYLDVSWGDYESGEDGGKVQLWDIGNSRKNNKFTVRKALGPGYHIEINGKRLEADADALADDSTPVQTWGSVFVDPHQRWWFYEIPKNPGKYLVVNIGALLKTLDADGGTGKNGCGVRLRPARSNDATQVWILEKCGS